MLSEIRGVFREGSYLVSKHCLDQALDRGIDLTDAAAAIREDSPEIIEDYPNDQRGPSLLILCKGPSEEWYHVQCAYPPAVKMITIYLPDPARWTDDFRRRRLL